MAQRTLFEILSGQPWWITLLAAVAVFWIAYAIFPPIAPFMALPFVLLALYVGVKQLRSGSPAAAYERLEELRKMPWEAFSAAVADAYRRRGYTVSPADAQSYDFTLTKDGLATLVQCRRWKVNQVGEAPVRELARAVERSNASRGICLTAGGFSAPARKVAQQEPVTLVSGAELVELIGTARKWRWWPRS